jgi:hypothetical protein
MAAFYLLPILAAGVAYLMATQWGMDTPEVRKAVNAGYLTFANVTGPVLLITSLVWAAVEILNGISKLTE